MRCDPDRAILPQVIPMLAVVAPAGRLANRE